MKNDEAPSEYMLLGLIKYEDSQKSSKTREAVLNLCLFDSKFLIISTVLNIYYVYLNMEEMVRNINK